MLCVAFLRNVNLGQAHSPTRPQLEAAFQQAGAMRATSFLSNGTVVYAVARSRQAQAVADRACAVLKQLCGMSEPAYSHTLRTLADYVAEDPFAAFDASSYAERAVTFCDPAAVASVQLPLVSAREDCVIFRIDGGIAFSITRNVSGKIGYPTPVLEQAIRQPVTTRGWSTILRLVARFG